MKQPGSVPWEGAWNSSGEREFVELFDELESLRSGLVAFERENSESVALVSPRYRESARNLLHYVALRRRDVRDLQRRLARVGLSSLGRAEAHVLPTIDSVRRVLSLIIEQSSRVEGASAGYFLEEGRRLLEEHTLALLGPPRDPARRVRVMVTLPSEAAEDAGLLRGMLDAGMDVARINCAHDGPESWRRMIANLEAAKASTSRPCPVLMDLAGPKLRTGPIAPGAAVAKWTPQRDDFGRVIAPARVRLLPSDDRRWSPAAAREAKIDPAWLSRRREGESVELVDARGKRRSLRVVKLDAGSVFLDASDSTYVVVGTTLAVAGDAAQVSALPPKERALHVNAGDTIFMPFDASAEGAIESEPGPNQPRRIRVSCTLTEALRELALGHRVWFDDGKIGAVVRRRGETGVELEVTSAPPVGSPPAKLAADKGINLPDTALQIGPLTEKDLADLDFVCAYADLVGLSFVSGPEDLAQLRSRLATSKRRVAVVLKIENQRAFRNLPDLLLEVMKGHGAGVMIARGDLAVEVGYERLAEVQEEILWLCEAAHVPVIWATQVLETLAKTGRPSRAEVTDAAMGERAECVMLNKGPYILDALRTLDGILRRMQAHQFKKSALLRRLSVAAGVIGDEKSPRS